jgi:hypothetical protein
MNEMLACAHSPFHGSVILFQNINAQKAYGASLTID